MQQRDRERQRERERETERQRERDRETERETERLNVLPNCIITLLSVEFYSLAGQNTDSGNHLIHNNQLQILTFYRLQLYIYFEEK